MRVYSIGVYLAIVASGAALAVKGVHVLGQTIVVSLHKPAADRPLSRVEERLKAQSVAWVAPVTRTRTTPGFGEPIVPAAILALQLDAAENIDARPEPARQMAGTITSASATASSALAPAALGSAELVQLSALKPSIEKRAIEVEAHKPVRTGKAGSKKRHRGGALIAGCAGNRCSSAKFAKASSKGPKLVAFRGAVEDLDALVFKPQLRRRDATPGELMLASLIGGRS